LRKTLITSVFLFTAHAQAQDLYLGEPRKYGQVGLSQLDYEARFQDPYNGSIDYSADASAWATRLGYDVNALFGAYVGFGGGLTEGKDTVRGVENETHLSHYIQAGVRLGMPLAEGTIYPYITLGTTRVSAVVSAYDYEVADISETDTHTGFGIEFRNYPEGWFVVVERQTFKTFIDISSAAASLKLSGLTFSIGTEF